MGREFWLSDDSYLECDYPEMILEISDTHKLNETVDDIRIDCGYLPFFKENEDGDYDDESWYNFFARLDVKNHRITDLFAEVFAVGPDVPDQDTIYHLEFDSDKILSDLADDIDFKELYEECEVFGNELNNSVRD